MAFDNRHNITQPALSTKQEVKPAVNGLETLNPPAKHKHEASTAAVTNSSHRPQFCQPGLLNNFAARCNSKPDARLQEFTSEQARNLALKRLTQNDAIDC